MKFMKKSKNSSYIFSRAEMTLAIVFRVNITAFLHHKFFSEKKAASEESFFEFYKW